MTIEQRYDYNLISNYLGYLLDSIGYMIDGIRSSIFLQ